MVLNLRRVAELKEFLEWHRHIVTWGLGVYVGSYVQDLENTMGAPGKESLLDLIMTEKEVTALVESMDLGEFAEQEGIEQEETEQATEQAETEQADTEQLHSVLRSAVCRSAGNRKRHHQRHRDCAALRWHQPAGEREDR